MFADFLNTNPEVIEALRTQMAASMIGLSLKDRRDAQARMDDGFLPFADAIRCHTKRKLADIVGEFIDHVVDEIPAKGKRRKAFTAALGSAREQMRASVKHLDREHAADIMLEVCAMFRDAAGLSSKRARAR